MRAAGAAAWCGTRGAVGGAPHGRADWQCDATHPPTCRVYTLLPSSPRRRRRWCPRRSMSAVSCRTCSSCDCQCAPHACTALNATHHVPCMVLACHCMQARRSGRPAAPRHPQRLHAPHQAPHAPPSALHADLKIACGAHAPRPQVDFVVYKLGKRLNNPHWVVALKALMVYHRLMRECDPSFQEQVRRSTAGSWVAEPAHGSALPPGPTPASGRRRRRRAR